MASFAVHLFLCTATALRQSPSWLPQRAHAAPRVPVVACGADALSRSEARARNKAQRDISQALVQLKLPSNVATVYSEALAAMGVRSASELVRLTKSQMDAVEMRSEHRQLLQMQAALEAAELNAAAAASPIVEAAVAAQPLSDTAESDGAALDAHDDAIVEFEEVIVVSDEMDGARVDAALAASLPPLSRSYFSELCAEGRVRVDGVVCTKKSAKLVAGSTLRVTLRAASELTVTPEPLPLDILYEDECMLAVNKASGMVTHPAPGHWTGTFANALAHRVQSSALTTTLTPGTALPDAFGDGLRPGIVHRLDRYTSGVLLGAKTVEAQRALLEAFAARRMRKVYLTVVAGVPDEHQTVSARIGRHPVDRLKMAVESDPSRGRHAVSVVHRLATDGRLSLVAVRIDTGRTHQIRVHMASLRCPVLGDPLYGDPNWNQKEARRAGRPLLHALQLGLEHPLTRAPLVVRAPPPEDVRTLGAQLAGCAPDAQSFDAWLAPRLHAVLEVDADSVEINH